MVESKMVGTTASGPRAKLVFKLIQLVKINEGVVVQAQCPRSRVPKDITAGSSGKQSKLQCLEVARPRWQNIIVRLTLSNLCCDEPPHEAA